MNTSEYLTKINQRLKSGISREHSYRGDLESLIRNLVKDVDITNEPANVTDCGNPDYVITKGKIPVGYIEAKDIGKDLNSKQYKEQFDRYRKALDNLIITDYVWFQFFQNGELVREIKIGEIENNTVKPITSNFSEFENLIKDFSTHIGQTIKSSRKLAEMMAGKARLLQDILKRAITSDEETQENTSLKGQYDTFKEILIHDLTPKGFADIYAQTLAYGMFAARLHDTTLDNFSRQEAAELIPKSNPFLRKLFGYIAGPDIDERIISIVNNLADVFRATNLEQLLKNFGKSTQTNDPIIHFYETFLSEYDSKLRKARGVWYTPEPVVKFIVRAVDDILKSEFDLPQGLADTSKTKIKVNTDIADKRSLTGYKQVEKEVHKVQILDPATGTGTFLAEVVKYIYSKNFSSMQGAWSGYVEEHLIPRLNGFELLMASYAMAHLKLDMLLTETGYKPIKNNRFNVYLTNSLEEHHKDTGTLFSKWLSSEANEANHIKRDTPVMCIIGNPPYSGISSNNNKWISDLIEDYKYVDGVHFNERKHWLNDDYVKFIRYGQYFIEKNGSGVLAYINPHGYLDNPTFRGMRWHLLKTYDKIYTIDLHGNSKKKETAPDGSADINVFDIQQGVSINIFVKTGKKKFNELGKVFHYDLFGKRKMKYDFLSENSLKDVEFKELAYNKPYYFFVPKDDLGRELYEKGFKVSEVFENFTSGMVTANDKLSVFKTIKELNETTENILTSENPYTEFKIKDSRRVSKEGRLDDLRNARAKGVMKVHFRPFDFNYMYQFDKNEHWINSPRNDVMQHFVKGNNIGLVVARQCADDWKYVLCTKYANDFNLTGTAGRYGSGYTFPLYIYSETNGQQTIEQSEARTPNLKAEIVNQITENLGLTFTNEKEKTANTFAPIDILDYIYAVLHSQTYREKYKEFLKIDFPRVPYPKDVDTFWQLVRLGKEIREIHLLESDTVEKHITSYPIDGDNIITTKIGKKDWELFDKEKGLGRIWINDVQYFDNVPLVAWEFYIGGYQPAQKWLKDRKERELKFDDILHYQKIIVALTETDRIMKEIDKIDIS